MLTFFPGWRRKMGVITLMLACVFMSGWVRSEISRDSAWIKTGTRTTFVISSYCGKLQFTSQGDGKDESPSARFGWYSSKRSFIDDPLVSEWEYPLRMGHGVDLSTGSGASWRYWIFSYWSIAIPLTLLCACLLLSKSRVAKPKTFAEN